MTNLTSGFEAEWRGLPEYCPFRPECLPYEFKILSKYQIGPILCQVRPTGELSHYRRVDGRVEPSCIWIGGALRQNPTAVWL